MHSSLGSFKFTNGILLDSLDLAKFCVGSVGGVGFEFVLTFPDNLNKFSTFFSLFL